jgi:3-dehydroquinate synthase
MAITDDAVLFELLEKYGSRLIETHFATLGENQELNPVQVETYSFFYSKTQVFKMDRV